MLRRFIFGISLLTFFSACQKEVPVKEKENTINLCFDNTPATVDPRKNGEPYSSTLNFMLYDGLMRNLPSGEVIPALAESYEISEDKKTYTFTIRDALWSDGEPITADDFAFSWKSCLDPKFPCINAQLFYPIQNALEISKGNLSPEDLGVHALDAKTLVVHLEKPTPYFLKLVCFCNLFPVPKHIAEKDPRWDEKYENLVVSGAFSLTKFTPHDILSLKKNPNYWNVPRVNPEILNIHIIRDPETALHLFKKKELDCIGYILSKIPEYAQTEYLHEEEFLPVIIPGLNFITFNTKHPLFKNANIRKAFSTALDRNELLLASKNCVNLPAKRLLPPAFTQNEEVELFESGSKEKALAYYKKGLSELGIDDVNEISLFTLPQFKEATQFIQNIWEKTFGIKVKIEQFDFKMLLDRLNHRNYETGFFSAVAQVGDPMDILERFKYMENSKNYPDWENPKYIQLLDASFFETGEKRYKILKEAEQILLDEMPLAPLFHIGFPHLTYLEGIDYSRCSGIQFQRAKHKQLK